jgi:hypothetical protein
MIETMTIDAASTIKHLESSRPLEDEMHLGLSPAISAGLPLHYGC